MARSQSRRHPVPKLILTGLLMAAAATPVTATPTAAADVTPGVTRDVAPDVAPTAEITPFAKTANTISAPGRTTSATPAPPASTATSPTAPIAPTAAASSAAKSFAVDANLAIGQPITASSVIGNFVPSKANDGDPTSYWEAAPGAYPNTLTVSFGANANISSINLRLNPAPGWGARTQAIEVLGREQSATDFATIVSARLLVPTGRSVTSPAKHLAERPSR